MLRSMPLRAATMPPARLARPARGPAPAVAAPPAHPHTPSRSVAVAAASTVRVSVQGRHLEVTDALKAYAVSVCVCV